MIAPGLRFPARRNAEREVLSMGSDLTRQLRGGSARVAIEGTEMAFLLAWTNTMMTKRIV